MNPLCPKCQATLVSDIVGDGLHCPDCDYSYPGGIDITIEPDRDDDRPPLYLR